MYPTHNSPRKVYGPSVPSVGHSSIDELPNELLQKIFFHLSSLDDINRCQDVCRGWKPLASDPVFRKQYIRCNVAFGCDNWTKCFGENAISDQDRKIERESLPDNIFEILNSECPAFPGKKVSETHMLVFIPKTIHAEPLTLNSLGQLAKKYFPENKDGYSFFWPPVADAIGRHAIDKAGWVLMTKNVLEGSRNKPFANPTNDNPTNAPGVQTQQQCVADLAKKAGCEYVVPPALLAGTCILSQFFKDGHTRLFSDKPWTFTCCQENVNGYQVVVGAFAASGLVVYDNRHSDNDDFGVAALRKF